MKNSIKLTALFLLASAAAFAATPSAKPVSSKDLITFSAMPSHKGIEVKVDREQPAKAVVMIYDDNQNVIFKDVLPANKSMEKGYILNKLENGDYTMEVTSSKQTVKKNIRVYNEDKTKVFIVKE